MNIFEIIALVITGSCAVVMLGIVAIGVLCEFVYPLIEELTAKRNARKL